MPAGRGGAGAARHGAARRCLGALPERERAVLVMTFYDDRPADAVAAELGLSAGNVRVIRHRGLERLRGCMDDRGRNEHDARLVHEPFDRRICSSTGSDELDAAHESRLDEHLFACAACSERLRTIVYRRRRDPQRAPARQLRLRAAGRVHPQDQGRGLAACASTTSSPAAA